MHKFRTPLLATTTILALSGVAYAADMPVKAPPPMAPAPAITWTGFYVGLQVGGASYDPSCNIGEVGFPLAPGGCVVDIEGAHHTGGLSSASVIGGGKIGYDWQWGQAVLGVVGEFDWTHLSGTDQTTSSFDPATSVTFSDRIDWLASARGRIGWTFGPGDNFLFYATGGVAWTQIKASINSVAILPELATQSNSDKTGGVAGAGFEYRVAPHVSVVGEVLWYGFGSTTLNSVCAACGGTTYTTHFDHQDVVSGTLGVNWRF